MNIVYTIASQMALASWNDEQLAFRRNNDGNKALIAIVMDAVGSEYLPHETPEGYYVTVEPDKLVYFISERHGAPWVRKEKVVGCGICTLPLVLEGDEFLAASDYFMANYVDSNGFVKANVIVPNYDYSLPEWN